MGHAEQRHAVPSLPRIDEQSGPALAIHPAKRLIQQRQPHIALREGAAKAYALPLTAGNQRAALTKSGLQTVRKAAQYAPQRRCVDRVADSGQASIFGAVAEIICKAPVPDLDRRIDPGGASTQCIPRIY